VLDTLAERRIGSALVTKDDKLVGIVTSPDVCRALATLIRDLRGEGTDPRIA
jgi:CBS domain-containing protein